MLGLASTCNGNWDHILLKCECSLVCGQKVEKH